MPSGESTSPADGATIAIATDSTSVSLVTGLGAVVTGGESGGGGGNGTSSGNGTATVVVAVLGGEAAAALIDEGAGGDATFPIWNISLRMAWSAFLI